MRLMPAKYAAALFDLDNTLWDRSAAILATGRLLHQTDPAVRATASAEDAAAMFAAFDDNGHAGRDRLIDRVLAQWPGITRKHEEMVAWYLEAVALRPPTRPDCACATTRFERCRHALGHRYERNADAACDDQSAGAGRTCQMRGGFRGGRLPQTRAGDIPPRAQSVGAPAQSRCAFRR